MTNTPLGILASVVLFLGAVFWIGRAIELGIDAHRRAVDAHDDVQRWMTHLTSIRTGDYRKTQWEGYLRESRRKRSEALRDFAFAGVWPLVSIIRGVRGTLEVLRVSQSAARERM